MKKIIILTALVLITGCKTTSIKNKEYKVTDATVELASIGIATSMSKIKYDYAVRHFPKFEKRVRLDVQILPFNKDINHIYLLKRNSNQIENTIKYVDSLSVKPKFVTIALIDYGNIINELNGDHNRNVLNYIKDVEKASIVTNIFSWYYNLKRFISSFSSIFL